jgi:hypothetical protein
MQQLQTDLCCSIGADCAKEIYKMFLEMRVAAFRADIFEARRRAFVMMQHPFYSSPTTHCSLLCDIMMRARGPSEQKAASIAFLRYIKNEFTQRYRGQTFGRFFSVLLRNSSSFVPKEIEGELLDYFAGVIPRRTTRQLLGNAR